MGVIISENFSVNHALSGYGIYFANFGSLTVTLKNCNIKFAFIKSPATCTIRTPHIRYVN